MLARLVECETSEGGVAFDAALQLASRAKVVRGEDDGEDERRGAEREERLAHLQLEELELLHSVREGGAL